MSKLKYLVKKHYQNEKLYKWCRREIHEMFRYINCKTAWKMYTI